MTAPRSRPALAVRPRVEPLEGRIAPANFTASTYLELRDVMALANANREDDTVVVGADIFYPTGDPFVGSGNELAVQDVTAGGVSFGIAFVGDPNRGDRFRLDANGSGRLFHVLAGSATFTDLTLTGGRTGGRDDTSAFGGAIAVESGASVTLTRDTVSDNAAVGGFNPTGFRASLAYGGAMSVFGSGTLNVTACLFERNQAVGYSNSVAPAAKGTTGGLAETGGVGGRGVAGGSAWGGAIFGSGAVTILDSVFRDNAVAGGAGGTGGRGGEGGGPYAPGAGGPGGVGGGGGRAEGGAIIGSVKAYSTTFGPNNRATGGPAGAAGAGGPGGVGASPARGGAGGPGQSGGDAIGGVGSGSVLGNCTLTGNAAVGGPGGRGGVGGAGTGGGASGDDLPDGSAGKGRAGALSVGYFGTVTFASTTVANNTPNGVATDFGATIFAFNSLFADNPGGDVVGGNVTASGSLIESTTATVTAGAVSNVIGVDPGLSPAAANGSADTGGGFVRLTHAIARTSAAADIGDDSKLTADLIGPGFAFDGRGNFARRVGSATDAGAFEAVLQNGPQGDLQVTGTQTGNTVTVAVTNAGPDRLPAARVTGAATGATIAYGSRTSANGAVPVNLLPTGGDLDDTLDLPSGATVTYTFTATVPLGGAGGRYAVAAVAGPGAGDPDASNNAAAFGFAGRPVPTLRVAVNQAAGQADPTPTASAAFDVDFSNPVSSFVAGYVSLAGSTAPGTLVVAVAGEARHFTVTVTGMTGAGVVVASVPGGQFESADNPGVTNSASTSTDNSVAFAPVVPPATASRFAVEVLDGPPTVGVPFDVRLTALAADGSVATGYTGTARLTYTPVGGDEVTLPDVTFVAGRATAGVTVPRAGEVAVSARDATTLSGQVRVAVLTRSLELTTSAAPVVGRPFAVTVTVRNANGTVATTFTGRVRVTLTGFAGTADQTKDASFTAAAAGVTTVEFTPDAPGDGDATGTFLADAGPTATVPVIVSPFTTPVGYNPLSGATELNARGRTDGGGVVALTSGRYYNDEGRPGDEPAVVTVGSPYLVSVLNVNPAHVSYYGLPNPTIADDNSATSITAGALSSFTKSPGQDAAIANDFVLTESNGQVKLLFDAEFQSSNVRCPGFSLTVETADRYGRPLSPATTPPVLVTVLRVTSKGFQVGGTPAAVAVGHFAAGRGNDVVVANPGSAAVNLIQNSGGGSAGFVRGPDAVTGGSPVALVAANLFGNAFADLAVVDAADKTVRVLKNDGSGKFLDATRLSLPAGLTPRKVVAADFDRDGHLDLAVSAVAADGSGTVAVFYGDGAGNFTRAQRYASVGNSLDLVVADVDQNGFPDLIVTGSEGDLGVLLHDDAAYPRALTALRRYPVRAALVGEIDLTPTGFFGLATGDFNNDGIPDVAVMDAIHTVYLLHGVNVAGTIRSRRPVGGP